MAKRICFNKCVLLYDIKATRYAGIMFDKSKQKN